ncbi:inner membrane protein cox18-like protein [Plakobranchus ocellatus]|uniref:Inner membrane protein cox18-like protein n=1 Tax=Plakobranchus ocellatus TaxID=259542 RepID=A0AAV3YCN7_9GAST|nr:inner membrane protein cox18-like protein [Plakobranchus ocellatus]
MSSVATLVSASSDQGLTQETALTSPVAETAAAHVASGETAGVDPGVDSLVDSVVETVTNASLLFPDFPTIKGAEFAIQNIHQVTGLPWWATITLTAFTLRLFLIMPLSVYSLHNAEKLNRLQPEIVEISKRLKQEVSMAMHQFKWDEKKAKDEYIKNV